MSQVSNQPILFVGHGSPMNAIAHNSYSQSLNQLGKTLLSNPPKNILMVSAHWVADGSYFTKSQPPKQIYDMYGFPDVLYQHKYIPQAINNFENSDLYKNLTKLNIQPTTQWGLDHGGWSVLTHLFPEAQFPVVQLSLNYKYTFEDFYNLGKQISSLTEQGTMIIGSGNIVHNLRNFSWDEQAPIMEWSKNFDEWIRQNVEKNLDDDIIHKSLEHPNGRMSIPTAEHFIPFIVALGARSERAEFETTCFFDEIQNGSMAMRSYIWK